MGPRSQACLKGPGGALLPQPAHQLKGSRKQTWTRGGKVSNRGRGPPGEAWLRNSPWMKRKADVRKREMEPGQTQLSRLTWLTFLQACHPWTGTWPVKPKEWSGSQLSKGDKDCREFAGSTLPRPASSANTCTGWASCCKAIASSGANLNRRLHLPALHFPHYGPVSSLQSETTRSSQPCSWYLTRDEIPVGKIALYKSQTAPNFFFPAPCLTDHRKTHERLALPCIVCMGGWGIIFYRHLKILQFHTF